jgi:hypothetical protein
LGGRDGSEFDGQPSSRVTERGASISSWTARTRSAAAGGVLSFDASAPALRFFAAAAGSKRPW